MDEYDDLNDPFNLGGDDGDKREEVDIYKRAQRMMFINDVEKFPSSPMQLGVFEFIELFNEPTDEDIHILSQCFIKSYLRTNIDKETEIGNLIGKWGLDWLDLFLDYNQRVEEYELCSIIKDVMDIGRKQLDEWKAEEMLQSIKDEISQSPMG